LCDLISDRRVVVWYDEEGAFGDFIPTLHAPHCTVVNAAKSVLQARRQADAVYRSLNEAGDAESHASLLVYLPFARGRSDEQRQQDPFELYCSAGVAFGVSDNEKLESLARQALPDRDEEIRRLFAEGKPTLALLDGLQETERYPLLKEALGTENPVEAAALALCSEEHSEQVVDTEGAVEEVLRLATAEFGYDPGKKKAWKNIRPDLAAYLLFSEYVADSGGVKADALTAIPSAGESFKERIYRVCDRMRNDTGLRSGYVAWARKTEVDLRLAETSGRAGHLGERDTFPFEEGKYLRLLSESACAGSLADARRILDGRRTSIWKDIEDRKILWTCAERCLEFLETAERLSAGVGQQGRLREIIQLYSEPGGLSEVDRRQRLFENSAATCLDAGEIGMLVSRCRARYWGLVGDVQTRFLDAVKVEGWPAEGVLRQTQVFARFVAPVLQERDRTAYFLIDSLRFEMGRDLADALKDIGETVTQAATTVLPASTVFGMAALMPGADGTFRIVRSGDDLVPAVGSQELKQSKDRMDLLKREYGQRFAEMTMDDLLAKPIEAFRARLKDINFLVLRTTDPDAIAETLGTRLARKYMTDVVSDAATAIRRLSTLGFTRFVVTADHGHVLVPEVLAGEVVKAPDGDWPLRKRRCVLGQGSTAAPGTAVFKAEDVGIQGDAAEFCVPMGLKVFTACEGYFHEGLSLQECLVPVVTIHAVVRAVGQGDREIVLSYGKKSFTSRVIGAKVQYQALLPEPIQVLVQVFGDVGGQTRQIGEAADCPERDESTHVVTLEPRKDVTVPVLIDQDFAGEKVEIRVSDPGTGVIWAKLSLKNEMMI
jgi:hypothetical protein